MEYTDRHHKIKTLDLDMEANLEPSSHGTDRHPMDEEEDATKEPLKQAPPSPSNSQKTISDDEELDSTVKPEFYGSDLDDKDEKWVEKKRRGRASDAVLSCPGCFTTLCLECQRHAKYVTQYRAIFVVNCTVKNGKVLQKKKISSSSSTKRKRNEEGIGGSEIIDAEELVKNVCCEVCSTVVGVMDDDQVYHFFNVLPSEA